MAGYGEIEKENYFCIKDEEYDELIRDLESGKFDFTFDRTQIHADFRRQEHKNQR